MVALKRVSGRQLRLHKEAVLSNDGEMLTACPKCHHVFVQAGETAAVPAQGSAPSSSCNILRESVVAEEETEDRIPCCASVVTLHVPNCAVAGWTGGSVILQKGRTTAKLRSPEPSPSTPLSFVLPTTPTVIMSRAGPEWNFVPATHHHHHIGNNLQLSCQPSGHPLPQSEVDLQRLTATMTALRTSGWYYEGLSWQESAAALMSTSPGTFLVRDSSDPRYLFSLSVQTDRGPTSVRLHYSNGHFRLDAEPKLVPMMPVFDCVVKLIEYYIKLTKDSAVNKKKHSNNHHHHHHHHPHHRTKDQVWIDSTGQMYSHILLTRPLCQRDRFPSLLHLARLKVNRLISNGYYVPITALPTSLDKYLKEYPYTC